MNKPIVIGICGRARSGKDTAAVMLRDMLMGDAKMQVWLTHMAGTLKQMITIFLTTFAPEGMTGVQEYYWAEDRLENEHKDEVIEGLGQSPRQLMQTLGTEWGRQLVRDDVWIRSKENRIKRVDAEVVIISDVRFNNEAELCDYLIHIQRDDIPGVRQHASEAGIADNLCDYRVDNNCTKVTLKKRIDNIAKEIFPDAPIN